ncbi:DUF983 domain-containing protein [Terrarubrum flagellatum]|uniref:DUF983 domain-containing protein n=1 Tax=Terrirubrum flagellatum TaxID=2895980 RepID=UPI003145242C
MQYPPQNPIAVGLAGKCPRCGQGKLFAGYLTLAPKCDACDLDYSFADSADGPAVFLMFIVGFIVVGGALWLEFTVEPAIWIHFTLWPTLAILLSAALLRPLKGVMICLQYSNRAEEGRFEK